MEVRVRVPAPSGLLMTNLLGAAGLLLVVFAIGALTDWRWGVLALGAALLTLVGLAQAARAAAVPSTAQQGDVPNISARRQQAGKAA